MNTLEKKVKTAKAIINKAFKLFPSDKTVVAWTGGKDSTVLLHLIRSTFNNVVPFPVMFNDSTMEFSEIYRFIKKITGLWKINLVVMPHLEADLKQFYKSKNLEEQKKLSRIMKIRAMNYFIKKNSVKAFFSGIRLDEHPARSNEIYFSSRKDHVRIHPILDFKEKEIWEYINTFKVPFVNLYKKGYRSLGEKPFTQKSVYGEGERSGRDYDKENQMQKLRNMGYW